MLMKVTISTFIGQAYKYLIIIRYLVLELKIIESKLAESNKRGEDQTKHYLCTTHPHQIYLEFLSEHGLVGTAILLFLFYKLIFSKIVFVIKYGNYIQLGVCYI